MLFQSVFAYVSDLIVLLLTHFFLLNKQYIVTITHIILNIQKKHFNNFQFIQTNTATTCIFSVKLVVFVLLSTDTTPKQEKNMFLQKKQKTIFIVFQFNFYSFCSAAPSTGAATEQHQSSVIHARHYSSLLPSTALSRVTSSAYSRSPPTGIP